jgi:hypothetical protein
MTRTIGAGVMVLLILATAGAAAQATGRVRCTIRENGDRASGTIILKRGNDEVARGSCGEAIGAPAGSYTALVSLDGALDKPTQSRPVTVSGGGEAAVQVDFATGTVEIQVTAEGRRAAAMATILRGSEKVGTVAGGVPAHLSAGTYDISVRYRGEEKRVAGVTIAAKQRREVAF